MSSTNSSTKPTVEKGAARPSRVVEWFWRGQALARARQQQLEARPRLLVQQRARIAAEVATQALDPSGPWLSGDARHLACSLFAESIAWSLLAATAPDQDAQPHAAAFDDRLPKDEALKQLLTSQRARLLDASGDLETLERVTDQLSNRSFEIVAQPPEDMERAARELRRVADRLLQGSGGTSGATDRLLVQRVLRIGALLVLLVTAVWAGGMLRERAESNADLSRGKPWQASSTYEPVCRSPAHHCNTDKAYFFHTQEEANPWLEIDLLRSESFSAVRVINRQDCCTERVAPLVVEVSRDHETWRTVASNHTAFDNWKASFAPVTARWVRFRVARRSHLHLFDVRVLR
jgi:hypothetical protein